MGELDNKTLEYFKDNRRFADLINARFFEGEAIVKPEGLQEADKELLYPWVELGEKGDLKTKEEILSGMKKEEKFCPVLSLVVYYGQEPYDGAMTLHELLKWEESTSKLKKYITNYHINIFDYHNQNNFEEFHTELQLLFNFLRYSSDKEGLKKLLADHKAGYYNVDNETYQMIATLTNSQNLLKYDGEHKKEEGNDMCKAIEEMIEDGIEQGQILILKDLVKDGILSLSEAAKRVNMTEEAFNSFSVQKNSISNKESQ